MLLAESKYFSNLLKFSFMSDYCNFANNLSNFQHYFSSDVETAKRKYERKCLCDTPVQIKLFSSLLHYRSK